MPSAPDNMSLHNGFNKDDTIIFFDWDDTLIPSSFLADNNLRLDSDPEHLRMYQDKLRDIEERVSTVLNLAMSMGRVTIVTNAEAGWVQLSSQKFFPGLFPLIKKMDVISARSSFEKLFNSPFKWKYYAFQEKLRHLNHDDSKMEHNIISFGDSHVEREAIRAVTRNIPNSTTKSVKFAERPSMEQLLRQIELVSKCFQYIHSHVGDLDLQLTVTVHEPSSQQPSSPRRRCMDIQNDEDHVNKKVCRQQFRESDKENLHAQPKQVGSKLIF